MRYLTTEEILAIHEKLTEKVGGSSGVREENLLHSIAERPKTSFDGQEQFPTLFLKAAACFEAIATYHVFVDGNKRTAITVAGAFLFANGYEIELAVDESEKFIIAAAQRQKELGEIAAWLEKNSKKA